MKSKVLAFLICALFFVTAKAQLLQRFDNINYKAIYFKEACDLIAKNPNLLLLDVRSPGEYADTSEVIPRRIGRLKGAINISIDSIKKHLNDLKADKGKPILVYCSHSQRSRWVSKLLTDSGFTNVYNLNGGMTEVNKTPDALFPCKRSFYTSNLPYKLMQLDDAIPFIRNKNNLVIDVRSASKFNNADSINFTNVGRIKNAINIPLSTIDNEIANLAKYKDRPILIYDLNTDDATQAALKLTNAGFKNVNVLFEGFDSFLTKTLSSSKLRTELITGMPSYKIIGVRETVDLVTKQPNLVIADIRPKEQFENKSKESFYNLGHINNAVNFTVDDLNAFLEGKPKTTPVLIYAAYKGLPVLDVSTVCKQLTAKGYTNVYLLFDGLYSVVWSSANVEELKDAAGILTDHKGFY